jgi:myosin heavy subunit
MIHQRVSKLASSPKSRSRIEQTFEEMLKSVQFFRKPDIIPFPYLQSDQLEEPTTESTDNKYRDLLEELERERNLRKAAEKENETLKDKLAYFAELEKQYEEYRIKALRINELNAEIEKLNLKLKLLHEENEELRRKVRGGYESSLFIDKLNKELEKEKEANAQLVRQLNEMKNAYEELRKTYVRDLNSQKERCAEILNEKIGLEGRLRESLDMKRRDLHQDDEIQAKLRNMKSEYKVKLRDLEKRLPSEKNPDNSESRLKEIEDRLAHLQVKLVEKESRVKHHMPGGQTSRGSTPVKDNRGSPATTWRTSDRFSPQRLPRSANSIPDKMNAGNSRSPGRNKTSPMRSSGSPNRTAHFVSSSRSPLRNAQSSPGSGHRLTEQHYECETCVRRHGHEWARSAR